MVQQGGTFSARFDTTGLATGEYRVELVQPADPSFFGSDSVTNLPVTIIDRSKEVTVTSPAAQSDVHNLTVAGTAPGQEERLHRDRRDRAGELHLRSRIRPDRCERGVLDVGPDPGSRRATRSPSRTRRA